jgi:hypothetical protein
VLRRRAPGCPIVDLTHGVRRQDVRAGSLALLRAAPYLADGVVLAIVDPGVGTDRRGVAVARLTEPPGPPRACFVAPDNGLVVPALEALGGDWRVVVLDNPRLRLAAPGPTFGGRDVFAPAAAHLATGGRLGDLGPALPYDQLVRLPPPALRWGADGALECEVTWVDQYGNVQLAATAGTPEARSLLAGGLVRVTVGPAPAGRCGRHSEDRPVSGRPEVGFVARPVRAFADLAPRELGLIVDSYGHLALCVNGSSAARATGLEEAGSALLRPGAGAGRATA